MKISKKGEYACLALIYLSNKYNMPPVTISEIAEMNNIPKKYLEQILLILKGTGYVKSIRGVSGGYTLTKPPENITLAEVIRLIDGALAPVDSVSEYFYSSSPIEQNVKLLGIFKDIRNYIADILENTTFKDLI